MSSQKHVLSARTLAELALIVARITRDHFDAAHVPSSASLQSFWRSHRSLEKQWMTRLDHWTFAGTFDISALSSIAVPFFSCDMLLRSWSTAMAGIDRKAGSDDLIRLARNALRSFTLIRNGILSRLLTIPEAHSCRVVELDRLRRRCERWTDLLIGSMAIRCDCFEFAFDADRARDFGEENSMAEYTSGPNVSDHLVSAGLRLNFIRSLPEEPLRDPAFQDLIESMLSSIPCETPNRDGLFRTLLERRIASGRLNVEWQPTTPFYFAESSSLMSPPSKYYRKNHREN